MAVEAPHLERATLERKDRAELVQIAEALGHKTGSRVKKADIVDKILELAGVTVAPQGDDGDEPSSPASTRSSAESPAKGSPDGGEGADDDSASDPADDAATESESGTSTQAVEENEDRDEPEPESANRRRRRRRGRDRAPSEETQEWDGAPVEVSGLLDLRDDGYGFLRVRGFTPSRDDVYVSVKQCRQLGLRRGDHVAGVARPPGRQEKNPAMVRIETVNGIDPDSAGERVVFDDLTPIHPDTPLALSVSDAGGTDADIAGAMIDLVAPVGRGQRVLVAVPPASGGSALLRSIAHSVEQNHPDVHLIVLMVNERPEEVTDMRRSLESGEVVASTFDRPADEHALIAELAVEHAKRLVEYGNDVVVILDGLHKLTRAHNLAGSTGGRTLQGGLESGAIAPAKRIFGAARNLEEGGSLTMFATTAVDTGSVVDGIIADEFAPTASSTLRLDRDLAAEGVAPALDVNASGTVRADLLVGDADVAWQRLKDRLTSEATGSQSASALVAERLRRDGSVAAVLGS